MTKSVGFREVRVGDESSSSLTPFPMVLMYPTDAVAKVERLGPYSMNIALDASPQQGSHPLVLISHGTGGSHMVYRDLAHHLAAHGFIVGMPEHPFNNRSDNSLEHTVQNLINRPRHLIQAIDWVASSEDFAGSFKKGQVSIIGHSMGGYTALAAAGGIPTSLPNESNDGGVETLAAHRDDRIKSLVLLAPASIWFRHEEALEHVNIPVLMFFGEKDEHTPHRFHAQIVMNGLKSKEKITYRIIENGGHFSFLSPFPASMNRAFFQPSQDPEGFDRGKFHVEMNAEILAFLSETLL